MRISGYNYTNDINIILESIDVLPLSHRHVYIFLKVRESSSSRHQDHSSKLYLISGLRLSLLLSSMILLPLLLPIPIWRPLPSLLSCLHLRHPHHHLILGSKSRVDRNAALLSLGLHSVHRTGPAILSLRIRGIHSLLLLKLKSVHPWDILLASRGIRMRSCPHACRGLMRLVWCMLSRSILRLLRIGLRHRRVRLAISRVGRHELLLGLPLIRK